MLKNGVDGVFQDDKSGRDEKHHIYLSDEIEKIKGGETVVVDIAQLPEQQKCLVFGDVIRTVYKMKTDGNENCPDKIVIFVDELNKYAPSEVSGSPIINSLIEITERGRSLVEDNGCGVSVVNAAKTLLSLGDSQKTSDRERGFRGIGQLGGIAYCDVLIFTTKAKGDTKEIRIEWNCQSVQKMLDRNNHSTRGLDAKALIAECVTVSIDSSKRKTNESFFRVEMSGVHSAERELFDYPKVKAYIEETAPLPFDSQQFYHGDEIDKWLRKEIGNYNTFRIFLNESMLKKRYTQTLPITKKDGKNSDTLTGYKQIDITDRHDKIIARGWLGVRKDNIGAILRTSGVDSLRVRVGNILIGDATLLDRFFSGSTGSRFNGYLVGEIHIVSRQLVPNGRRDDFQDSEMKSDFFNGIRKIIIPLEKEIYNASKQKNLTKPIEEAKQTIVRVNKQVDKGFAGDAAKKETLSTLKDTKDKLVDLQGKRSVPTEVKEEADTLLEKIDNQIDSVKTTDRTLTQSLEGYTRNEKKLIDEILDSVYKSFEGSTTAQQLVDRVIAKLKRNR